MTKPMPPALDKEEHYRNAGLDPAVLFPVIASFPKISWELIKRAGLKDEVMDFLKSINARAPGALSVEKTRGLSPDWTKRKLTQTIVDLPDMKREAFLDGVGLKVQVKPSRATINQIAKRVVVL